MSIDGLFYSRALGQRVHCERERSVVFLYGRARVHTRLCVGSKT